MIERYYNEFLEYEHMKQKTGETFMRRLFLPHLLEITTGILVGTSLLILSHK